MKHRESSLPLDTCSFCHRALTQSLEHCSPLNKLPPGKTALTSRYWKQTKENDHMTPQFPSQLSGAFYGPQLVFPAADNPQTDKMKIRWNIKEHLATRLSDISLRRVWRPNQSWKENEYWTWISLLARNATPNKSIRLTLCFQLVALPVNGQNTCFVQVKQ